MVIVESGNILKTSLTSQSYANVYNLVKDNVTDPTGAVDRNWIHTRDPSIKAAYDEDYPKIIIWPVRITQEMPSLDTTTKDIMWECEIEIRSTDRDESGLSYIETISDNLFTIFNGNTNQRLLHTYGMQLVNLNLEDTDYVEFSQERVYISRFILTFQWRLNTS